MNTYSIDLEIYLQVLDAIEDIAIVTDDNFQIVNINRQAERFLGEKKENLIGKECHKLLFDRDEPCNQCLLCSSHQTGQIHTSERYFDKWDKHFIVKSAPLQNEENGRKYYLETLRDARQIKEERTKKEEREQKFKSFFHHAATGMIIFNQEGIAVEVNPQAGIIMGFPPNELLQTHYQNLLIADEESTFENIFSQFISHKKDKLQHETRLVHRTGSIIWVKVYFSTFIQDNELFIVAQLVDITYEKSMENILIESENRFRSLYENAPLAYQSLDENGYILDINPRWLKTLGYARNEVICRQFTDFLHPDYVDKFEENFPKFKSKGYIQDVIFCMKQNNGDFIYVSFEGCIGYTPEGKLKQTYCVFKDISKEIETQKELTAYRHRLERAENVAAFGHWIFNLNTQEVNASHGAYEIYGLDPQKEKLTILEVQKIPTKKSRPLLNKAMLDLIHHGKPYDIEFQIKQYKTGKIIDIHSVAEYDRESKQVFGVIQDVTTIKEARRQLQESTFFAHSVLNSLQEGIIVYDTSFNYTLWNKKMEQITGKKAGELMGKNASDIFPHIKQQGLNKLMLRALKGEIITSHDVHYINENTGQDFWYFAVYSPYFGIINKIKGVVAVITDITERKIAEEGLKASNEALRKANAELDNFVYRVSHDLRAPITSSLGLTKLTQLEQNPEVINHYAALQEESLLKLDKFIHDILDYSRNARMEVEYSPIDFDKVVQGIIRENKKNPVLQQVKIIYSLKQSQPLGSDPLRVSIILNNIIANAYKFHRKYVHKPFIKIKIEVEEHEAVIVVEDNGMGIGQEHQDKIFNMFYRGTDKKPGTGIGLYIVKDCLDKLMGSIEVMSKLDEGTRFIIKIPNRGIYHHIK